MRATFTGFINELQKNQIFVFGSNPEGRHGGGTAKIALDKYGAIYGQGHGLQGQSYGLVTKNLTLNYYDNILNIKYIKAGLRSVSREQIINNIKTLYKLAKNMKDKKFMIAYTATGNNLNGYMNEEMAEMFYKSKPIPKNIIFEDKFLELVYIKKNKIEKTSKKY